MQLFRKQALDYQNRLHGEVFLAPPLKWQVIGWMLLVAVIAAGALLTMGSHSLTVQASGTVRLAPERLMTTDPEAAEPEEAWIAELRAPASSARSVAPGQTVTITLPGYPAQGFGALRGRIATVAAEPVQDTVPYVPVTALLAPPAAGQARKGLVLHEHAPVDASIVVGRISLFCWLFGPALPAAQE